MNPRAGIGYKVASTFVFSIMSILVKEQAQQMAVGEVMFFRAFFGLIPVIVWLTAIGQFPAALRTKHPFGHLTRTGIGSISMALWFTGLSMTPVAQAQAISFIAPLLAVGLSGVMLHEFVGKGRWVAVSIGFAGIAIVLSPDIVRMESGGLGGVAFGSVLILGSAFCNALAVIFIRRMTATETTGALVFYFTLIVAAIASVSWFLGDWSWPTAQQWPHLVLMGLAGGIGQVFSTTAYRHSEASALAPFDYISMVWMVAFAFLLFAEVPSWTVVAGAAVVVCSGIIVAVLPTRQVTASRETAV